jgi:hypothetical protein
MHEGGRALAEPGERPEEAQNKKQGCLPAVKQRIVGMALNGSGIRDMAGS